MRVIGGEFKGRRLRGPVSEAIGARPTSDRVRTVLFDTLSSLRDCPRVCDLYAGTGALGIEALSRGGGHATFVERDPTALGIIRANLASLGLEARATVVGQDVRAFLEGCDPALAAWSLILADPPYGQAVGRDLLARVARRACLTVGGRIVIEHAADEAVEGGAGGLGLWKRKVLGQTVLSIFERLDG